MNIKEVKLYETEIAGIKRELEELPEGHLIRKKAYYYLSTGSSHKGISTDKQTLRQLARKAYLQKKLENFEWNLAIVKKEFGRCKAEDYMEIIRELPAIYQTLPVHYFSHSSAYENIESKTTVNTNPGPNQDMNRNDNKNHPERLIYITESGARVRSKSELFIANALYQKKIHFYYEAGLALGGKNRAPDFTIYRPSDGKMFLWEHFGLMDDNEYLHAANEKIALYARYGFHPFKNLIITYEEDIQNPTHIQAIIDMFFAQ